MNNKETLMFRMVPTMRCNFRCEYCFLSNDEKTHAKTMFDEKTPNEWINGMKQFDGYNVELYFWGGEPFVIDGTYELLNGWLKMNHIISGIRIDTNLFFADKIADRCPSNKLKLNCSYHMQYHTLDEEYRKIKMLKELDMIGMVNFVASPYNLEHLKSDYGMTIKDLIEKFAEIDVFVNVAADFKYANNTSYERYQEYKDFILQFLDPEEWKWLRDEHNGERLCSAGQRMFTLQHNGDFTSCISSRIYGNFFNGELIPDKEPAVCRKDCPSLVAYPFRLDNDYTSVNSLLAYVDRQKSFREKNNNTFKNFVF